MSVNHSHRHWKTILLVLCVLSCLNSEPLSAQCTATMQFPLAPIQASHFNDMVVISDVQNAGQYSVVTNLSLGQDYIFTAAPGDYITVRDAYDNTILLDHGASPLTYSTGAGPDLVAVHINLVAPPCGTDTISRVTTVHCISCPAVPLAAGINTTDPRAALEVDGKIKVGEDAHTAQAGMIRWNQTVNDFEGYDGTVWRSLTGAQSTWGTLLPGVVQENHKLTASDGEADAVFGRTVAVSGDYAIIGASRDDENGAQSGAAYIFRRNGNAWIEQNKLTPSDGAADDEFGWSVAISGDYAIVGVRHDDDNGSDSGSAYIFHRSGATWVEQDKLTASDGAANDVFGYSVAISGDYAIVGARDDDDNGSASGSAYIFRRNGSTWTEQVKLTASDGAFADLFGYCVSISGEYAIVGAPQDDDAGGESGSAYVFHRSGSMWSEQDKLTTSDAAAGDHFGVSVSISGDYAIAGARYDDDGVSNSGSAYVFIRSGSNWTEQDKLTAPDGVLGGDFGNSVSISGDYAVVGANGNDGLSESSGSAYLFQRNGSNWIQQVKLTSSDGEAIDLFGWSVSISGEYVIVGAQWNDDHGIASGSAYFFKK